MDCNNNQTPIFIPTPSPIILPIGNVDDITSKEANDLFRIVGFVFLVVGLIFGAASFILDKLMFYLYEGKLGFLESTPTYSLLDNISTITLIIGCGATVMGLVFFTIFISLSIYDKLFYKSKLKKIRKE